MRTTLALTAKSAHDIRMHSGMAKHHIIAFVPIIDVARAKEFYGDRLGLRLVSEEPPYALVFDANGIMLRLTMVKELPPFPGTVLGWNVSDASAAVKDLQQAGIRFEHYEYLKQDAQGIWTTPTGARVAWFKDPDGDLLSISEHPEFRA